MPEVSENPVGYTVGSMDEEMNYPNPVVRTDLPVKKRRWPKIVGGLAVLLLLVIVFLPQILSTRVGRKFVAAYLTRKSNCAIVIESVNTSWFGGTTIKKLWFKDPLGRRMGFESMTCQASMLDFLRGKFKLGDATVDGLYFDYVMDDGRGVSSFDRMGIGQGGVLPNLSGRIKINSGAIAFWRGTVQPKLYNVTWDSAQFANAKGTLDIKSLDQPWTYAMSADIVDYDDKTGPVTSSGTVDLGENGRFDPATMSFDLKFEGTGVRTGPIGAVLTPGATPEEVQQVLGASLDKLDIAVKAADGKITFEKFDATGKVAEIHGHPTIDLTGTSPVLMVKKELSSPEVNRISVGVCKRLGTELLVHLSPFFRESVGGGTMSITFDQLRLPLAAKQWKSLSARGSFSANAITLARSDDITGSDVFPKNLASQVALLTGDDKKTVELNAQGPFSISDGQVAIQPVTTSVGGIGMSLEGITDLETGAVTATATFTPSAGLTSAIPALAGSSFAVPLTGDGKLVQLALLAPRGSLTDAAIKAMSEQINHQVSRMKSRETQRLMNKGQQEVQSILRPLQGNNGSTPDAPGDKK